MKLTVEYIVEGMALMKEFEGEDPIALVEEAKADILFKQCTSATFEMIEEDDGTK